MTRYLLDTNIISNAATKPSPSESLVEWMAGQYDDDLFISSLTVAEIRRGILSYPRAKSVAVWMRGSPVTRGRPSSISARCSAASAGLSGELHNGQVRLLAGHDQDIPCGECTRDLLDTAKRNIENSFAVVGLTERFDESLVLMGIALGWNWTPYYLNRNVTQNKPVAKQIDPLALKAIEQANQLDFELYDWASLRFQDQLAQHKLTADERLAQLYRANRLYRPWGELIDGAKRSLKTHLTARASASA